MSLPWIISSCEIVQHPPQQQFCAWGRSSRHWDARSSSPSVATSKKSNDCRIFSPFSVVLCTAIGWNFALGGLARPSRSLHRITPSPLVRYPPKSSHLGRSVLVSQPFLLPCGDAIESGLNLRACRLEVTFGPTQWARGSKSFRLDSISPRGEFMSWRRGRQYLQAAAHVVFNRPQEPRRRLKAAVNQVKMTCILLSYLSILMLDTNSELQLGLIAELSLSLL